MRLSTRRAVATIELAQFSSSVFPLELLSVLRCSSVQVLLDASTWLHGWDKKRPSSLLFVGSMNVSRTILPFSVGGMGLMVSALQYGHRFCCVVALAGASHPAVVSAVVLSTAVVVPTAVPQAVASGPLVKQ